MKFCVVLLLILILNLRVLAQEVTCSSEKQSDCVVVSGDSVKRSQYFTLSRQSILSLMSQNNFTLLKGLVWFKAQEAVNVKTEYGRIEAAGAVLIDRRSNKWVRVAAIGEGVAVILPGWGRLQVPNGFELSFSELQSNGKSKLKEYKVLTEANLLNLALNSGMDRESMVSVLGEVKKNKPQRVAVLSEVFKQAGMRKIASDQKVLDQQKAARQRDQQERAMYKAKLKSKIFDLEE